MGLYACNGWLGDWFRQYLEIALYDRREWWQCVCTGLFALYRLSRHSAHDDRNHAWSACAKNPLDGIATLAVEAKASPYWRLIGGMGLITGLLILSFYSIIGGWVLQYMGFALQNNFVQMDSAASTLQFSTLLASPSTLIAWHTVFMVMTWVWSLEA